MAGVLRLRTIVSRYCKCSNADADTLVKSGRILVDGKLRHAADKLFGEETVTLDGEVIREGKVLHYVLYYKPRGVECSLNPSIPESLKHHFKFHAELFPVGRLDKDSEGLLLMTNDGRIYNAIASGHKHVAEEKEYLVTLSTIPDQIFYQCMREGVEIMGEKTRPADVIPTDDPCTFRIILTQGKNRQIRRMCYKLGYDVVRLIRIRLSDFVIGDLKPGAYRALEVQEIRRLRERLLNTAQSF